jgi:hypothetical protein
MTTKSAGTLIIASAFAVLSAAACAKNNGSSDNSPQPGPVAPVATKGPAAGLKCTSSGKNAWDTYGVNAFVAVNKSIIGNVGTEMKARGTSNLGDSFTKVGSGMPPSTADDGPTFEGNLAAFLVYVYGGPQQITYVDGKMYNGPQDMVEAHTGLGITSAQYDYFVTNIVVPALTKNGVPMGDIASCFAPPLLDAGFKSSIVGH